MKYLKQFGIICAIAFAGEILNRVLPLPVPASVYGIILRFVLLLTGVLKKESIKEVSSFLIGILPIMFVAPSVGILDAWETLRPFLFPFILLCVLVTVLIFFTAGTASQFVIRKMRGSGTKQKDAHRKQKGGNGDA